MLYIGGGGGISAGGPGAAYCCGLPLVAGYEPPAPGFDGGGGGIRTPGTVSGTAVFKTAALNHSATPPGCPV